MMRRILPVFVLAAVAGLPASAAPPEPARGLRAALLATSPGAQLVWWHAGGVTPGGERWHAGGTGGGYRWGGAYHVGGYHPPAYYHGYGAVHYGGFYRPPVAVTPWVHPVGTFAAGAMVGAAAASGAAATAAQYGQPPTVVNNYYYNNPG
ncbi:hypothetical protein [Roseomonas fluvialis]|uniref:Uncharacterized protein n=1 Tax=Roseomonas fluvialis TaxID=1750527 RepID=A0ABM7XXJ1_9PROT|nr:hypothetical protein [Roseomonas fluvialis]BDG70174.1 hypothetical protein Rmf_01030 [Roseomonas fluvialis]